MRPSFALCLALPAISCAQPLPTPEWPPLSPETALVADSFAGCWTLAFDRPFPGAGIASTGTVFLDTIVVGKDAHGPALAAKALSGFSEGRRHPFELVWQPRLPPDPTLIAIRSTSGVGWHVRRAGDSLVGRSFEYWDLGPSETDAGLMSGHRVPCPETAASSRSSLTSAWTLTGRGRRVAAGLAPPAVAP